MVTASNEQGTHSSGSAMETKCKVAEDTCCCGCCSLKTGSIMIALLGFCGILLSINSVRQALDPVGSTTSQYWELPDVEKYRSAYVAWFLSLALFQALHFISSCFLLIGAISFNYKYCAVWLIWNYIHLVLTILIGIILVALLSVLEYWTAAIAAGIGSAIALVMNVYFIYVVRRFMSSL